MPRFSAWFIRFCNKKCLPPKCSKDGTYNGIFKYNVPSDVWELDVFTYHVIHIIIDLNRQRKHKHVSCMSKDDGPPKKKLPAKIRWFPTIFCLKNACEGHFCLKKFKGPKTLWSGFHRESHTFNRTFPHPKPPDCWNPARKPVDMVNIPLFTRLHTRQVGCLGFLNHQR